jgi:hypothetical protein
LYLTTPHSMFRSNLLHFNFSFRIWPQSLLWLRLLTQISEINNGQRKDPTHKNWRSDSPALNFQEEMPRSGKKSVWIRSLMPGQRGSSRTRPLWKIHSLLYELKVSIFFSNFTSVRINTYFSYFCVFVRVYNYGSLPVHVM